jgi:hypothetical protein
MRANLALVPKSEEIPSESPAKPKRDRRMRAVFSGVRRVRFGAEGNLYLTMKVQGPKGEETWIADFSVASAGIGWDTDQGVTVFKDISAHLTTVARVVPRGETVRLSHSVSRRLRKKMLEAIVAEHKRELAELEALLARYTLT